MKILVGLGLIPAGVLLGLAYPIVWTILNITVSASIAGLVIWKFGPLAWELFMNRRERAVVEAWSRQVDEAMARRQGHVLHAASQRVDELETAVVIDMPRRGHVPAPLPLEA